MKKTDSTNKIWQLKLFSKSKTQLLNTLVDHLKTGKNLLTIYTPNPEQYIQALESPEFFTILSQGDILLPDGTGLVWGYRTLAEKYDLVVPQERLAGIDVARDLLEILRQNGQTAMVIGGREYHHLPQGVEWYEGFENVRSPRVEEAEALRAVIAKTRPTVVFVALGAPFQEQWVHEHRVFLQKQGVKIAMVVGGAFDVLTGKVSRAPQFMQQSGTEWLYRLLTQPWRWRRQVRLLQFVATVAKARLS